MTTQPRGVRILGGRRWLRGLAAAGVACAIGPGTALAQPPKLQPAKAVYIRFSDDNRVPARVIGTDIFSDVALLKVDPKGLSLTPLKLGSTQGLQVGSPVARAASTRRCRLSALTPSRSAMLV